MILEEFNFALTRYTTKLCIIIRALQIMHYESTLNVWLALISPLSGFKGGKTKLIHTI